MIMGVLLANGNQVKKVTVNMSPMYCDMIGKKALC